jgi:serine/threonine-protein kinase
MTKLDVLIERARDTGIDRAAAVRYVRQLVRRMEARPIVGETMGSYHIVRQIGEGGMGAVYLGTHSILGRPAAIKVLHPELSRNRDIVGRFFNEARAAAAIRHPGIVDIYDFGFLADGSAYIAMEYLEGETLGARLRRRGRLSVGSSIEIARQIAAALHAAHGKAITHRDLKPDNVFLVQDPEIGERIKLLDFGIAKLAAEDTGDAHTRTGMVMGTPMYMSPEQCRGTSTLDGRSDLYSLGCILYELLAGRPVFDVDGVNDIVAHHMYFQPEPIRSHEPSVPEPLAQLIESLLSKDPAMRPATASDFVAMLERCKTSGSTPAVGTEQLAVIARVAIAPERRLTTLSVASGAVSGRTGTVSRKRRLRRLVWLASAAAVLTVVGAMVTTGRSVSVPVSAPTQQPISPAPGPIQAHGTTSPGVPPDAALVSPPAQPTPAAPAVQVVEPPAAPGVPAGLRVPVPSSGRTAPPTSASPRSEVPTNPASSRRTSLKPAAVPPPPAAAVPPPPTDTTAPPIDEEKLLEKRK